MRFEKRGELTVSDSKDSVVEQPPAQGLRRWLVPALTVLMATGIVFLIASNWKTWESNQTAQVTDDAYVQANLTPPQHQGNGTGCYGGGFRFSAG